MPEKYFRKSYINREFGEDIVIKFATEVKENVKIFKAKVKVIIKLVRGDKEIPIWECLM